MHQFINLSIRVKILTIVFGGVLGIAITLGFNYNASTQNKNTLENIWKIYFPILERLDASLVRLDKIKETYTSAATLGEEELLDDIVELKGAFNKSLNEVSGLNTDEKKTVSQIQQDYAVYAKTADALSRGMIDENLDIQTIQAMQKEMVGQLNTLERNLGDFRKHSYQRFTSTIDKANADSTEALIKGIAIGATTVLILALTGIYIGNSITNSIRNVGDSLKAMASGTGDLTTRLKSKSEDEIGVLVSCFNAFMSKLAGVIHDVKDSSAEVSDAASEMKKISQMSLIGMNSQNEKIGNVVTSMEEMTNSVKSVSESANSAASIAGTTRHEANTGKNVVEENMESIDQLAAGVEHAATVIEELDKHSESIGTVLNVIRGIAEQTNLLALNAAIEAARAGEQGRGFAVVADEVRTLATRTHDSTQEIDEMISRLQTGTHNAVDTMNSSRTQAQASVANAARVRESLDKITQGIAQISEMNIQIAGATDTQNTFAQEINSNIINLGQVVLQVTEDAHVAEKNSEKVAELAQLLMKEVSVFGV